MILSFFYSEFFSEASEEEIVAYGVTSIYLLEIDTQLFLKYSVELFRGEVDLFRSEDHSEFCESNSPIPLLVEGIK